MKTKMSKLFALVLAAVMLTAVLSACDISIGNNESGGFGDISVPGGSSAPGTTSKPDPTESGQPQTSAPDTSTQSPETTKPSDPPNTTPKPTETLKAGVIGQWENHTWNSRWSDWDYYYLTFYEDGTFYYLYVTTAEYSYKGTYSIANGRIYFKNVVFTNGDKKYDEKDSDIKYVIELDSEGKEKMKISETANNWMGDQTWSRK